MLYRTKPLIFKTPEDFQKSIENYLETIEKHNASIKEYLQCSNCNKRFELGKVEDCCDEQHIVHVYNNSEKLHPSLYGFCAFAGIHRQTMFDYKKREGYDEIYEWFLSILQMDLEQILLNPGTRNIGGAKFVAVNNYGWKDKTDVEHSGTQPITFINDISGDVNED